MNHSTLVVLVIKHPWEDCSCEPACKPGQHFSCLVQNYCAYMSTTPVVSAAIAQELHSMQRQ